MTGTVSDEPNGLRRILGMMFHIRAFFGLAAIGLAAGLISAYVSAQPVPSQPPAFDPAPNPYPNGIYASGIVESRQSHGSNISIFPEITGPITRVLVAEGDHVRAGATLVTIDDSVQREVTEQQKAQMEVAKAQIESTKATLRTVSDTLAKQERSLAIDQMSVSREALDTSRNSVATAAANLRVAETNLGSLSRAASASQALLDKYTIRAPSDGVIMAIQSAVGSYVSPQGAYDPYTHAYLPLIVMGSPSRQLEVRCYVDEILISRLPPPAKMQARMFIQGTRVSIPLRYDRLQPYVSPKIELSDQRLEQVDVRVLPVIFGFDAPTNTPLYPGQLVDVYIGSK